MAFDVDEITDDVRDTYALDKSLRARLRDALDAFAHEVGLPIEADA